MVVCVCFEQVSGRR